MTENQKKYEEAKSYYRMQNGWTAKEVKTALKQTDTRLERLQEQIKGYTEQMDAALEKATMEPVDVYTIILDRVQEEIRNTFSNILASSGAWSVADLRKTQIETLKRQVAALEELQ